MLTESLPSARERRARDPPPKQGDPPLQRPRIKVLDADLQNGVSPSWDRAKRFATCVVVLNQRHMPETSALEPERLTPGTGADFDRRQGRLVDPHTQRLSRVSDPKTSSGPAL